MSKFNIEKEAGILARIIVKAAKKLEQAENSAWQSVSKRVLENTIPNSSSLGEVKNVFDQLGELVDVSLKTWSTSYRGVLMAVAKQYHNGRVDADGVKALSGLSLGGVKKAVGWGPKAPKASDAPKAPDASVNGNTGAVAPETLPTIGKAPEKVQSLNGLYDAVLPAMELARDAMVKFSKSGTKVSKAKAQALADLAKGIEYSLVALAKIIE